MANEGTVSASIYFNKSGRSAELGKTGLQFDISGVDYVKKSQAIGFAAEEAIQLGSDIATLGWFIGINRSTTYDIKIRPATGVADMILMKPGEPCLFRMAATAPYAIAVTGAAELEYLLIEE
jgi:hypothetical protein